MRLRFLTKLGAVATFALGVLAFGSSQFSNSKEKPKSFVVTYTITRSENGESPVVTGLAMRMVDAEGQWKRITARRLDNEYHRQISVSFLDKTASYRLEEDRLEFSDSSESELERDQNARTPDWITKSPLYVRQDSMLGLKVYITHQDLNDGWVEQAFSELTRSTPLLLREHFGNIEQTEEAASIEFRDIPPSQIRAPDLPISFEWSRRLEKGMAANSENAETVKQLVERREAAKTKLRAAGRMD